MLPSVVIDAEANMDGLHTELESRTRDSNDGPPTENQQPRGQTSQPLQTLFRLKFLKELALVLVRTRRAVLTRRLPSTSFVERVIIADEETAFSGVSKLSWRSWQRGEGSRSAVSGADATYETCWQPASALMPSYGLLVRAFEMP
ncbi:hypothetical protein GQ600_24471 [Phytophthora cactorum]|nr:hypothetical protein GQ600_24471 [Phytophthora cactorum]